MIPETNEQSSEAIAALAWDIVETFLHDWQKEPYRWNQEIDVQVEIAGRLSTALKVIGKDTVKGNYHDAVSGFEGRQVWNRVCCEPKLWLGPGEYCFPDVVVWDDIQNPDQPPDAIPGRNWPAIWLCEIKLDWSDTSRWDKEKLEQLISKDIARSAVGLELFRRRAEPGADGLSWSLSSSRLRFCKAKLPTSNESKTVA